MTKTISLADDAYEALALVKRQGESFSELARRLARDAGQQALWDRDLKVELDDAEAEAFRRRLRAERDDPRNERTAGRPRP